MANEHPMRDFSCKVCTIYLFFISLASERPVQEITRLYCTLLLFVLFVFLRNPSVLRE